MSILSLVKATFYGHVEDRKQVLSDLQAFGCLHLIPLIPEKDTLIKSGEGLFPVLGRRLDISLSCPYRRKASTSNLAKNLTPLQVEQKVLELIGSDSRFGG